MKWKNNCNKIDSNKILELKIENKIFQDKIKEFKLQVEE